MTFSSVTECGGLKVEFVGQRNFSAFYSAYFGEHACAATSLLNEISEQYSRENGETVNSADLMKAMLDAVESGSIDATDATVNNWVEAANEMAESLGLEGTYKYSNDRNETDIRIFASDTDGDGKYNHFVNDIGGGQYYDPWTGKTGNIADLTLATEGLGQTRNLSYTIKEG